VWCALVIGSVLAALLMGTWRPALVGGVSAGVAVLIWAGIGKLRRRSSPASAAGNERNAPTLTGMDETDPTAALYAAARHGHSARALELLQAGADPHALPPADARDQRSLLALAAVLPELDVLRALIAQGVDINQAHSGMTALIAVTRDSWHGRPDAVTTLIANGADPSVADADGNTPLHHAARSTDPSVAALLCNAGAEIAARNRDGVTPLGMACACGNWPLAKFLIEHGARPEDAQAAPALLFAAGTVTDDTAGIELLLRHKAQVNSRDGNGRSALHEAALHGHVGIIQALLAAGADADTADAEGRSPLLETVWGGHLDALDALIKANADVHRLDGRGRNALALACLSERPSVLLVERLLEAGVAADCADQDGKNALDHAVSAGHWALVKRIDPDYPLPLGVNETGNGGEEPLPPLDILRLQLRNKSGQVEQRERLAALLDAGQLGQLLLEPEIVGDPETVRWLLAKGAHPGVHGNDGKTPLECLLGRFPETLASVQILLQHEGVSASGDLLSRMLGLCLHGHHTGPELEQCALELAVRSRQQIQVKAPGHAPTLTQAVRLGWDRLVEELASNGTDLNARDPSGLAALHLCAALGREAALRILIRHGAAIDLRTQDGQNALGIALAAGHLELAQWLDWRGWPLPARALRAEDVPAAAMAGDTRAVLRLLDLGLPPDATDDQGCTALLRACGGGHLELVQHLIERGANLHHMTHSGAVPLSAAVSMNHTAIIDCLLQAGAKIEQRLPGDLTVLMLAAARGLPEACGQLLDAGAQIHALGQQGLTALHCAAQYGFGARNSARLQQLFKTLLLAGADSDAVTDEGLTPLLLLLGARAEPGSARDEAVIDAGVVQLLDAGARLDAQDPHGWGPLHLAALHGLAHVVRRLAQAGADLELRDRLNRPPRAIAIERGFIDIATELTQTLNRPDISMARFLGGRE